MAEQQPTFRLYSKPGCHLCEGLMEKLQQLPEVWSRLTVCDITTSESWWQQYQYEIPVLCVYRNGLEQPLPRFSPREPVSRLRQHLQAFLS